MRGRVVMVTGFILRVRNCTDATVRRLTRQAHAQRIVERSGNDPWGWRSQLVTLVPV